MHKLTHFLDDASRAYYNGEPFLTDEVFDSLAERAGYNKVGAPVSTKIRHMYPMFSLQKHYADEGASPLAGINNLCVSPKLDGAAISTLYIGGKLIMVLTRGDGVEGQDITDKFLATNLIPHEIPHMGLLQITGEVCAPKMIENARNYAAGALNLKSVEEFKTRAVEFFAYGVNPMLTDTYYKDIEEVRKMGFHTVMEPNLHNIYPCDGVVRRVNSNKLFTEMGFTAKHPRGAYALKERQEAVETRILDVEWQVGKSGKVTPVAILEPVLIGDAVVSRATLNNPGFIESLDIDIGDTVAVVRSGEVIPRILHKVEA